MHEFEPNTPFPEESAEDQPMGTATSDRRSAANQSEHETENTPAAPTHPTAPPPRYMGTRHVSIADEESEPKWGTAHFGSRTELILIARDNGQQFVFDAATIDELIIGRFDPDTNTSPPVDLEAAGGMERGVSRRHASIIRQEGLLYVSDHGSHNGTFLNGQRLVPRQPRILRDGDDLRLAQLVLRVKFVRTNAAE
jgi:hypothetical protein